MTDKNHADETVLTIVQGKGTLPREQAGRNIHYDNASLSNYKMVQKGDFIIHLRSFEGGLEIANENGIVSPAYTILRGKKPHSSRFYEAYFHTDEFINHVLSKSVEGIRDGRQISYDAFKWLSIPYCNPNEQEKIADLFSTLSRRIEKQSALVDSLKKYKRGLLNDMFPQEDATVPKLRLAGFTGEWVQHNLGDLMNVTSVKRIHQSDWTNSGVRFLRARDIVAASKNEKVSEPLFISQEKYNEYSEISGMVKKGDLLVTGVGTIGVPMLINSDEPLYFKDGNIIWFKNENIIDGKFFYYSFVSDGIQKFILESAGTGTVGTYTIDSGRKTPVYLPVQREEQIQIGKYFSQLDALIVLHQRKLDILMQCKNGIVQQLFI